MNQIIALALKDLKLLLRDKAGFFFTFFFPLVYAVFFGSIFASQSKPIEGIRVAVVDEDQTPNSVAFIEELAAAPELDVLTTTRAAAGDLVRTGKRSAFIVLTQSFGEARDRMFWGDPATLELGVDPSRAAEAGMLEGVLMRYAMEGFQDAFANPDVMRDKAKTVLKDVADSDSINPIARAAMNRFFGELDRFMGEVPKFDDQNSAGQSENGDGSGGWQPVVIQSVAVAREYTGPKSAYEISFPQSMTWGVLGCTAAFGISLVIERTHGTLVRLRTAPIQRWKILGGKALACFVTTLATLTMLIVVGILLFGIRPSSYALLAMAFASVAAGFVGIMMFISVLGRTEQSASGIGWGVLTMMAMLGGGMVPLLFMPGWMKVASHASPVKWAIVAMEGAVWRNYTTTQMLLPCGILLAFGVVFFVFSTRVFRWTDH